MGTVAVPLHRVPPPSKAVAINRFKFPSTYYRDNSGNAREIISITSMTLRENGVPGTGTRFEITVPRGGYRYS
jgi:hypothetical protein